MSRFVRFIRAKEPSLIEKFLNQVKDSVVIGSPVFDGKAWVAWIMTTNKKIKSGDLDK